MRYQPALDGLRALSVLTVVIYHLPGNPLKGGWIGVDIFFVLSGFLITKILLEEIKTSGNIDLKRFYVSRFLRLAPALFLMLATVAFVATVFSIKPIENLKGIVMALTYIANWNLIYEWWPSGAVGHSWTLAIEEQFYLVFPILLLITPRKKLFLALIFLFLISTDYRFTLAWRGLPFMRTQFGFDTHSSSILIGCMAAMIRSQYINKAAAKSWPLPLLGIFAITITMPIYERLTQSIGIMLASIFAAWLVIALQTPTPLGAVLSKPLLVHIGKLSYGLYLWHHSILVLIYSYYWPSDVKTPEPDLLSAVGVWVAVIGLSIFASALSFRYVETPALKLKQKLFHQNLNPDSTKFSAQRL